MMNNKQEEQPIDIEKRMNNHWAASYMAQYSAEIEEPLNTVAYRNLLRIARTQKAIADSLSNLILAYFGLRNDQGES